MVRVEHLDPVYCGGQIQVNDVVDDETHLKSNVLLVSFLSYFDFSYVPPFSQRPGIVMQRLLVDVPMQNTESFHN